jgi:hypothetical protein
MRHLPNPSSRTGRCAQADVVNGPRPSVHCNPYPHRDSHLDIRRPVTPYPADFPPLSGQSPMHPPFLRRIGRLARLISGQKEIRPGAPSRTGLAATPASSGVAMGSVLFTPSRERSERLIAFSLDVLESIDNDGVSELRVAGWIETRGRSVCAICFHTGYGVTRLDVVASFTGDAVSRNCKFRGVVNVGGLGANFSLVVTAAQGADTQSGETSIWLGEIVGRQRPLSDIPLASAMAPISVTCLGRTGSTLMMQILSAHPEIIVAGGYPHETKFAQEAFHKLGDTSNAMRSNGVHGKELCRQSYNDTKRDLVATIAATIDHFYQTNAQAQEKPAAKFFAEKCLPSFMPNVARDIYGPRAKEIIIMRDPRDLFCSAISFNRKRGRADFGADNYENDLEWFRFIRHCFLSIAQARDRRAEALTIRYEDLILDQRGTILKILRFLDVRDSDGVIDSIEAQISQPEPAFVNHMTSETSQASIGRWRFHENPDVFKAEDQGYLRAMHLFGYL